MRTCRQFHRGVVLVAAVCAAAAAGGCGTSDATRLASAAAPAPTVTVAHPAPGAGKTDPQTGHSTNSVLHEVNIVCAAVRAGGPRPLSRPYTGASLARYANAEGAPTQRTVVSLTRLERLGDKQALLGLVNDYTRLRALYGSAGASGRNSRAIESVGRAIVADEAAVTSAALADGLPACGVAGR